MTSRASQLSGATAVSSASSISLTSLSSASTLVPQNGGPVQANNNILNQRADSSRSLYQICVNLRQRLAQVPDFDAHLIESDEEDGDNVDPMSSLWRCLRKGTPLLTIYNALQPAEPLYIDEATVAEAKRPKIAAFKFVQACLKDLQLPPGECFVISDLFGDDTTGFVKVRFPPHRQSPGGNHQAFPALLSY
jgi:cell division control protein 24